MGDVGGLEERDKEWEATADRDDESALRIEGERISGCGVWKFDWPWHFLESGVPSGNTLLKRRHLELLSTLSSPPLLGVEWDACKRAGEKEQYMKSKQAACGPFAAQGNAQGNG